MWDNSTRDHTLPGAESVGSAILGGGTLSKKQILRIINPVSNWATHPMILHEKRDGWRLDRKTMDNDPMERAADDLAVMKRWLRFILSFFEQPDTA
ncbi:MAG: hypothetical protein JWM59_216 [Verrucomicrobiales bacterium]|nr:hypothetical protein [Verrucomicrobiales bacterium]